MPRFNPLVEGLSTPPIPLVQSWGRAYDGSRGLLIDLSQAVPGYPPHPDLLAMLGEAASSRAYAGYGAIEGDDELRLAYARHASGVYGAAIGAENIHVTAGCNQAFICSVMAIAGSGDTLLMTNPYYFNHETTLAMLGIATAHVNADAGDGFLPGVEAIAEAITPGVRALAIVSPNNPTGAVYPAALLKGIFELCRQKGIWLILDETYRDFLAPGREKPHDLFSAIGWQETLIGLYSFSKSFCIPGHRLGAITAGHAVVEQVAKVMDNVQICPPRPVQGAVARMIDSLAGWREENRREIGRRADALRSTMADVNGWQLAAMGAYFAFVRHPYEDRSSEEVAEMLAREAGIVTLPGAFFGEGLERYLRFAFANADSATISLLKDRLPAGPD
jgi:hypothetical protein